jgi:hypothetical protein
VAVVGVGAGWVVAREAAAAATEEAARPAEGWA